MVLTVNRDKFNFIKICVTGLLLNLVHTTSYARILTSDEVSQADTQALIAETDVFRAIGMGIALSLANCEGVENCNPSVNQEELKQLLDALDNRISHLQGVLESGEISEEQLNQILTAYVDEREKYLRYLDQLGTISPVEDAIVEEESFSPDIFSDVDEEVEDYSVFEDTDSDIIDETEPDADLEAEPAIEEEL